MTVVAALACGGKGRKPHSLHVHPAFSCHCKHLSSVSKTEPVGEHPKGGGARDRTA